jgi:DNA-binding CsgD family transcriptional regulator
MQDANICSTRSRWSADLDRLVRARYDAGESAKSIARSLKADRRTVRASLERTGRVRTYAETRAVASVLVGREAAVVAMREQGTSLREIGRAFGVSADAVLYALRGVASRLIPLRSFGAARGSARWVRRTSNRSATRAARTGSDSSRRTAG